ncbi:MAG: oxidoreductase [Casimicrobiaceae bacterium]|nr:oxidoreductase [Casimicrobiaceae bacterium]
MEETFKAYLTSQKDGGVESAFVEFTLDQLDPGEVVIRVEYSTVNYKDALSATGAGRIIRRFPCIGGIDLAGVVESSQSPEFRPGDCVLVHGYGLGVTHHGGYAQKARVPAAWVVPLPQGFTTEAAMRYGTAGFTAALAVDRLERAGLTPEQGPVLVSGATGGVGMVAIEILAKRGYHVVALTGKAQAEPVLRALGAREVLVRGQFEMTEKPLGPETYAGAIDNLGGATLAWLTRVMRYRGVIAAVGLAQGAELKTTVMPFILRGVTLIGIDSVQCALEERRRLWQRLAAEWRCPTMEEACRCIDFLSLPEAFPVLIEGRITGRTVVRLR